MQEQIVLISDDPNFFEYILPKFSLRKNDLLLRLNFNDISENLSVINNSAFIINSENARSDTLKLLDKFKHNPSIVFAYNEDEELKLSVLKKGAMAFITLLTSDEEFQAIATSLFKTVSLINKNSFYRDALVKNNVIADSSEIILDYNSILDTELKKIVEQNQSAVLAAISLNDKDKFLVIPEKIESAILNNIRNNDILMRYAANKYFLLLYNADVPDAEQIFAKISNQVPYKIYAGFAKVLSKTRQQLINEVLNKLHESINYNKINNQILNTNIDKNNFKAFKQDFLKNLEKIIIPVFYQIKQKYTDKLYGVTMDIENFEGGCILNIKRKNITSSFKLSSPGFSKINIDITESASPNNINAKRISLNPEELESGLLEDLLEQFITEFKQENLNE